MRCLDVIAQDEEVVLIKLDKSSFLVEWFIDEKSFVIIFNSLQEAYSFFVKKTVRFK